MKPPDQDYIFIVDESGISTDRFTVVGGIVMHRSFYETCYKTLLDFRKNYNMNAELKWSKVSDQKFDQYSALVDHFFALNNSNKLHFHCIIFDNHQWDHKSFNQGDRDVGLSKLYYQLILHKFVRICGKAGSLYVRVDKRLSSTPLVDLQKMLNAAARRDHQLDTDPIKQIVSWDSKQCDLLQLNDVILGAVCAARNGRHLLGGGRSSKKAIAASVLERCGLNTFEESSPRSVKRFTVWNMRAKSRR
jgi:hypothetical protein